MYSTVMDMESMPLPADLKNWKIEKTIKKGEMIRISFRNMAFFMLM